MPLRGKRFEMMYYTACMHNLKVKAVNATVKFTVILLTITGALYDTCK